MGRLDTTEQKLKPPERMIQAQVLEQRAGRPVHAATQAAAESHELGILDRLAPGDRERLYAAGVVAEYEVDQLLFEQGDTHDGIILILEGRVRSYYISPRGRIITLAYWPNGHFVGAPQILGGGDHMWTSVAVSPTRGLKIEGRALEELVRAIPDLAVALIEGLVHKSKCYTALLQLMGTESKTVRLAHVLLTLMSSRELASPRPLSQDFTQEELASMIGATRQAVSVSLDRFEQQGFIQRAGHRIAIADPIALRRVCE